MPSLVFQAFRDANQIRHRVNAENETHPLLVPAIKLFGLSKIRIAAQKNLFEPRSLAQRDRLVETNRRPLVRWTTAATVYQI